MARLTTKGRKALKGSDFAGPGRTYPDEDSGHARAALSRVSEFGSPALKAEVRRNVHEKYPGMKMVLNKTKSRTHRGQH